MVLDAGALWAAEDEVGDELPAGTVLLHGQYTIKRLIGTGGFGITYLAEDKLHRDVVLKECFVSSYCRRTKSGVRAGTKSHEHDLELIIAHFITEAQRMASLAHPNIVGVRQVFEENETAYIAVEYVNGKDLLHTIGDLGEKADPKWLMQMTAKLLSALGYVHAHALLHCDISPDNILVDENGQPRLIDFGAARLLEIGVGAKKSGPLVIKDGYSPHELYFDTGTSGPWTDVYSLGATLAHCILGSPPVPGPARLAAMVDKRPDPQAKLTGDLVKFPEDFLRSINKAMSIMPKDRYQSAAEWNTDLQRAFEMDETNVKLFRRPEPKVVRQPPAIDLPEIEALADAKPDLKPPPKLKGTQMAIHLAKLSEISGFIGACLVDSDTGLMMASEGGKGFDLEAASAANTEVVKAKLRAIELLGLNDHIDDILISLGKQLHLIRPLEKSPAVFIYVALDRKSANLGMARVQVKNVEKSIAM